jgi:hypothetical protein
MLSILLATFLALPAVLLDLVNAIASPILVPLLTSGIVYVLNTYTTAVARLANPLKQLLVVTVGVLLGYVGQHFGLDITTAGGFASSLVALGIFQLGKAKAPAP